MTNEQMIRNLKFDNEQWKNLYYAVKAVMDKRDNEIAELKRELEGVYSGGRS